MDTPISSSISFRLKYINRRTLIITTTAVRHRSIPSAIITYTILFPRNSAADMCLVCELDDEELLTPLREVGSDVGLVSILLVGVVDKEGDNGLNEG